MNNHLDQALERENKKFREYFLWLNEAMPPQFFEDVDQTNIILIVHNLMELDRQDYVSSIQLRQSDIIISLNQSDSDLQLLKNYSMHGITSYQTYISNSPPPFIKTDLNLRIVVVQFYNSQFFAINDIQIPQKQLDELRKNTFSKYPDISEAVLQEAIKHMNPHFIKSLTAEDFAIAVKMYERATSRDHCQYEVEYIENWESNNVSMKIILAWRNTPKHNFLYRLIRTVHRHELIVKRLSASYYKPYNPNSILLISFELHGKNNRPVWEMANLLDFMKDLITVKYFASFDAIDQHLVQKGFVSGNMGNLLRAMTSFIHQSLVHLDMHMYTLDHIEEGLCRHPELTVQLCQVFRYRFDPDQYDEEKYQKLSQKLSEDIEKLDTGHEENDLRRKNILQQALNFIIYTLKTNFYRPNYTSLSFRLDPKYLDYLPFDRTKKFPEMPYAIIFIKGMHFFGFHIRFKDLARGGLRTVYPEHTERMIIERNNIFLECYNLAWTQQLKNKDIPEGGAKGIIFLKPYERLEAEANIYKQELTASEQHLEDVEQRLENFKEEQKREHLYQAQRSFIESLVTLINCEPDGRLKAKGIVDYWKKPEYIYLGPDENMHDTMIQWIANYSVKHGYKPGSSFISGKPELGINHKEYGVTSLGLNVYVESTLKYLGCDPYKDVFTVKMAGGPDGDVAGNEICNLYRHYPNTAKLIALTDISGTIYEPKGLDLAFLASLFKQKRSIRFYPPEKLSEGGFLLDKFTKRQETSLIQQTLCWRMHKDSLIKDWLSGSEMHSLMRNNVHKVEADIFIPAGGRPRTLNASNVNEFLNELGKPTAKGIVEGANLYLDFKARRTLEELGVLVIKDSSANKTGVICSSFEVLCGLALGDKKFIENKSNLIKEIRERLYQCALDEATLLFKTHQETGEYLTEISDRISKRINLFSDQILNYLDHISLKENNPLMTSFFDYCLPLLRDQFPHELMKEIPESHKKAIIACHISAQLVYERGLSWFPSVVDILPIKREENR